MSSMETGSSFAAREAFGCEVRSDGDVVRVEAFGALDMATVPRLRERIAELRDGGCRRFIVDLRRLAFMDSSGLRLMLELSAEARRDGISVGIVPGGPAIQRVFEITGTMELLPFVSS